MGRAMIDAPKKHFLSVEANHIPEALRATPQWVCWRAVWNPERSKWDKRPCQQNGRPASSTDPSTWGDFSETVAAYEDSEGEFSGVGFVLTSGDSFTGVDLDHCVAQDGIIAPWASRIIDQLESYSEISPSGSGVRIFIKGQLPPGGRRKGNVELYDTGRFLTLTGHHVASTSPAVEHRQAEIEAIHTKIFGQPAETKTEPQVSRKGESSLTDDEVIRLAKASKSGDRFQRLMAGDWSRYSSQSEADQSLCNTLAFWCQCDPAQMDRIFRQSGLMRDKWDKKHGTMSYGRLTIAKAVTGSTEVYKGAADRQPPEQPKMSPIRKFGFIPVGQVVANIRPPDYLIDGAIEVGTLGLIFGDPGSYKTFVALSMLLCIASGLPWCGREVKQGPVVYIVGEGRQGLARRILAWGRYNNVDVSTLPFFISTMPAALIDPASGAEVAEAIAAITEQHGAPLVVAIDTLARNFGAGDENSTQDMGKFIANLDQYIGCDCCRILVHHSGHSDKMRSRGNSSLRGAVDFEFRLTRKGDGAVEMITSKMKDAPMWRNPMRFEPRTVLINDEFEEPIKSIALEPVNSPEYGVDGLAAPENMRAAMELLHGLYDVHRKNLETDGRDQAQARVEKSAWRAAVVEKGLYKRQSAYRMVSTAVERGLVKADEMYVYPQVSPCHM